LPVKIIGNITSLLQFLPGRITHGQSGGAFDDIWVGFLEGRASFDGQTMERYIIRLKSQNSVDGVVDLGQALPRQTDDHIAVDHHMPAFQPAEGFFHILDAVLSSDLI